MVGYAVLHSLACFFKVSFFLFSPLPLCFSFFQSLSRRVGNGLYMEVPITEKAGLATDWGAALEPLLSHSSVT